MKDSAIFWLFGIGVAFLIGLIVWAGITDENEQIDCRNRGGQVIVTHGPPIYIRTGDMLIPYANDSWDCVIFAREE